MKIDIIENYNNDYPNDSIIRLFHFTYDELQLFIQSINVLITCGSPIWLTDLTYISKSYIHLCFIINEQDIGIIEINKSENIFHCLLTVKSYLEIMKMIKEHAKTDLSGCIWLYDLNNSFDLLLSLKGNW